MNGFGEHNISTLFSSERDCVAYLFKKRWPMGFICPFCGTRQKEMAPAYTVVCRYCRKQTSITAHTPMHGTKKSLIAWMLISWQFCFRDNGISAREVQRLMKLGSYQTAWRWLQKIRHGAAQAESTPVKGCVLFDYGALTAASSAEEIVPKVGIALEFNHRKTEQDRLHLAVLPSSSADEIEAVISSLVLANTTLLLSNPEWPASTGLEKRYTCRKATKEQLLHIQSLMQEAKSWMNSVYRGAVDTTYMQDYLSEFSFRYNTASWTDRLSVFEHLLKGLITSTTGRYGSVMKRRLSTKGEKS